MPRIGDILGSGRPHETAVAEVRAAAGGLAFAVAFAILLGVVVAKLVV